MRTFNLNPIAGGLSRLAVLALAIVSLPLMSCGSAEQPEAVRSRVAAVTAQAPAETQAYKWCDVAWPDANAPELALPALAAAAPGRQIPQVKGDRWTWINLWATWCGPCQKEMPLLARWEKQLSQENVSFDLWYLSVDEDADKLATFVNQHADRVNENVARLQDSTQLESFLTKYGVSGAASIPIQVLVGPQNKMRCIKLGQVHDEDYRTLKTLLKGG